jgi:hypothetical protein
MQQRTGAEHFVAFPEHGGTDLERLTGHRLDRAAPALQGGLDIQDGNASDHL